MTDHNSHVQIQEDTDLYRAINLVIRNYKVFLITIFVALAIAFLANRYVIPVYKVSASLLIHDDSRPQVTNSNDYLFTDLLGTNRSFTNELFILRSTPIIRQTANNLDLYVNYFERSGFRYLDAYNKVPFRVLVLQNHVQPLGVRFYVSIKDNRTYTIYANAKETEFMNLISGGNRYGKEKFEIEYSGASGELIETSDLAFIVEIDSTLVQGNMDVFVYGFSFSGLESITNRISGQLAFDAVDREATVIEISINDKSYLKGIDIIDELMNVYSNQNLERKNHIAEVTIAYIDRQLEEISDSLNLTEDNLQQFRSSRQVLDMDEQATVLAQQYADLQNQMAELLTRKRYYDYLAEYLETNEDFANMIVPASMGIQDQMLNSLVSELIAAQAQRSNLIKNNQERNPLVQTLGIQIENTKGTISENITASQKTTDITIDEMNKRISKTEAEIRRIPQTQRELIGIERTYRLNDAIYNYLLEKRAEAKISQASNLPDNTIVEPASYNKIISPNPVKNLMIAFALAFILPYVFLLFKSLLNNKIELQANIANFTSVPVFGKIPHNRRKIGNVVFNYPRSGIAEAYRALRTNIEYRFKDIQKKLILVSSSMEGEGKSFIAQNIAMSYALLGVRTILIDFDLRKPTNYFGEEVISQVGLSTFISGEINVNDIILTSPHNKLDYIPSGPIPPNPLEMITMDETTELITYLKEQYDCIVMDTSPLAQVSDAYLLFEYSNINIIVARYNYTLKKVFHFVLKDLSDKNINNTCVVMNDNRIFHEQYGYGYGYEKKKKSVLSRIWSGHSKNRA